MSLFICILCSGIVLLTILPTDKLWCNGLNEVSYTFRYSVKDSGLFTHHWEERRSDIVHGAYSFLEPDGQIRIVEYQIAGKAGFRAAVTFRKPPGFALIGPLKYPVDYNRPIRLAKPVAVISADLFDLQPSYPNLPE